MCNNEEYTLNELINNDEACALVEHPKVWGESEGRSSAAGNTHKVLPGCVYRSSVAMGIGFFLKEMTLTTDDIRVFTETPVQDVVDNIRVFLSSEAKARYKELGMIHKRGILLFGKPGTAKTCAVDLISREFSAIGGITIYGSNTRVVAACLEMTRKIQPTIPILTVLEDIDSIYQADSHGFLALLDGEDQIDGVVFLATTNYPEQLPERIIN